jgi:hypothetical protein
MLIADQDLYSSCLSSSAEIEKGKSFLELGLIWKFHPFCTFTMRASTLAERPIFSSIPRGKIWTKWQARMFHHCVLYCLRDGVLFCGSIYNRWRRHNLTSGGRYVIARCQGSGVETGISFEKKGLATRWNVLAGLHTVHSIAICGVFPRRGWLKTSYLVDGVG